MLLFFDNEKMDVGHYGLIYTRIKEGLRAPGIARFCDRRASIRGKTSTDIAAMAREFTRSPVFPNVPTAQEQGLRDFEALQWHGFFAPAATPDAVIKQVHAAVVKALASPEVKSRLTAEGASVVGSSPAEFAAFFQKELDKWTAIAKRAEIQPE